MISQEVAENFVRGVFTDIWCQRCKDLVDKYYHKDFIGLLHGTEEFRYTDVLKRVDYSKMRYENPTCIFEDIFPVGDNRIIARVSMSMFDRQTQKQEILHLMGIIEMLDGKMYRQWTLSSQLYRYKDWA